MSPDAGSSGDWRQPILRHFSPQIAATAPLTIVDDSDNLLADQMVLETIHKRGFDVVTYDDPIAFRLVYESRYRCQWDEGRSAALVALVRGDAIDVDALPYDLLSLARRNHRVLRFRLTDVFPHLWPSVVAGLDRREFDAIFQAVQAAHPQGLGERATKDFVLRHVYDFAPELAKQREDLLRLLLRRHYRDRQLPSALDQRLIERLRENQRFSDWPLEQIIPNRNAFFAFLQERWPLFVRRWVGKAGGQGNQPPAAGLLTFSGPDDLPFDHEDVRVYIDNLFVEGLLAPTGVVPKEAVAGSWIEWGVLGEATDDARARFAKLTGALGDAVLDPDAGYQSWIDFALRWFEWSALRAEVEPQIAGAAEAEQLWLEVDTRFREWMLRHYGSLHNLAYLPAPVMVHHVVRHVAHRMAAADSSERIALIVLDGISGVQWVPLRESIPQSGRGRSIQETAVLAWVPTITPVSRQAIFAGEAPFYFAQSLGTTAKDEQHWRRFWEGRGMRGVEVQFVAPRSQETEPAFLDRLLHAAGYPACRALAAVIPTIDQMAHGAVTGARGLQAQASHWAGDGHFWTAVDALLDRGFTVYVTSDHGNVECIGVGKPNVGALAEERGERVHVFSEDAIRAHTRALYPGSIAWPPMGLPDAYLPLIAARRDAFMTPGRRAVSHGGMSLEEVIVPFVTIEGDA